MKAIELVMSPSFMAGSLSKQPAIRHCEGCGFDQHVEESTLNPLGVLLLFTVFVCALSQRLHCLTWSIHSPACPGTLGGDCVWYSASALERHRRAVWAASSQVWLCPCPPLTPAIFCWWKEGESDARCYFLAPNTSPNYEPLQFLYEFKVV